MRKAITMITVMCLATLLFAGCQYPPASQQAHVHTLTHNAAKAPTCVEDGLKEHWNCLECGKYFSDTEATVEITFADIEVDKLGHTSGTDDNDCTTAVACALCEENAVEAKTAHTDENNDYLCDIEGCTYDFPGKPQEITTVAELQEAFLKGGSYKLMNDLDADQEYFCTEDPVVIDLDLGGHTLTLGNITMQVWYDSSLNLSNGTIWQTAEYTEAICCRGTATITNCTLIADAYFALYIIDGLVTVEDSVLAGGVCVENGYGDTAKLTAIKNVEVKYSEASLVSGICVAGKGEATFGFDPSNLLDDYNKASVTDNGNGTWTMVVK